TAGSASGPAPGTPGQWTFVPLLFSNSFLPFLPGSEESVSPVGHIDLPAHFLGIKFLQYGIAVSKLVIQTFRIPYPQYKTFLQADDYVLRVLNVDLDRSIP